MNRSKSIDEIYEEVREYDIVITNDAPLATALNARIDRPTVGGFAYTPRQLAADLSIQILGEPLRSDLDVVATVSDETGYGFKYVHGEIENIRNIRKYTSDVEKYLYSRLSRNIYNSYRVLPTIEKAMDIFVPETYHENSRHGYVISDNMFAGKKTAVIGIEFFDDLDKHFIPIKHEEIEIAVQDEDFEIGEIFEIGNDRQIAENIIDLIDSERATDVAIVMDTESGIADAVRAALYRRGIPFKNTMAVRDLSQIRDYLRFLNLGASYGTVRVRHVRELFSAYKGTIKSKHDNVLLSRLPEIGGRALELAECMKNLEKMTFLEVCDLVVGERHRPQVHILLEELNFTEKKVTPQLIGEMNYAVNNVSELHHNEQIPDSEKKGVLLADCHRSMFVDRPFVAFLGMGEEWGNKIIGRQYIDKEAEAEMDAMKFRVLLQQGTSRIYAVNTTKNGKAARPTSLFDGICKLEGKVHSITGFGDIAQVRKGSWYKEEPEIFPYSGSEPVDCGADCGWKFTKSSYNNYCECPRAFYYGNLVTTPDNEHTAFGNLLHEFAEMYVCYPDHVRKRGLEYYAERIGETYAGLSCPLMENVDMDRIRVALRNLIAFIDVQRREPVPLDMKNTSRKYPNGLMESEGLEMCSSYAERDMTSSEYPIYGKFDLLIGPCSIDYKTGKYNSETEVVKGLDPENKGYMETQPMMYLALIPEAGTGGTPVFRLFFIFGTDGRVKEGTSVLDNKVDVRLLKETKMEALADPNSPPREDFEGVTSYAEMYENWDSFISPILSSGLSPENWENDGVLIDSILSSLRLTSNKTNIKKVVGALKRLKKFSEPDYWACEGEVCIPSDSMGRFLEKLLDDHAAASKKMRSRFAPEPRMDCSRCNFISVCTREPVIAEEEGEEDV
ncbi:MAG: PD-(D/E)XK nuclease family protein [Methanomassiliicoccaceae archaeon]|nr:PD-(D/E)XK nuclease family protein [Methanomassiliicoccaceae archaeon]